MFVPTSKVFSAFIVLACFLSMGLFSSALAEQSNERTKLASNTSARGAYDGFSTTLEKAGFDGYHLEMLPDRIKSYNDYQPRIDREQPRLLRKKHQGKVAIQ